MRPFVRFCLLIVAAWVIGLTAWLSNGSLWSALLTGVVVAALELLWERDVERARE